MAKLGAERLKAAYRAWVEGHEANGGDRNVELTLAYDRGLSGEFSDATGRARLDLVAGRVEIEVAGLPDGEFEAWIVDNLPGPDDSVRPEARDARLALGTLTRVDGVARLTAEPGPGTFDKLQVDLVTIARAGNGPQDAVLYGSLPLFQRLYTLQRVPALLALSDYAPSSPRSGALSLIPEALAQDVVDLVLVDDAALSPVVAPGGLEETAINSASIFDNLVATGSNLFINERFKGNGRTCATCHPIMRNTQLSVEDIAALPDSNPLFAAEFVPALAFTTAGAKFEVPVLMRGNALILENVDGMDDLVNKFTMRGIPHTLALRNSLTPSATDGTTNPPVQRTGWGGDGAPGNGSLRSFATGAVTQHFTKTLRRIPGTDFRLPTDRELDAMEAFQLSLGRQQDLALPLRLKDPIVARGQTIFLSPQGRCNACHGNAGANASFDPGKNRNFNTGVESQVDRPTELILTSRNLDLTPAFPENLVPRDGGFGNIGNPQTPGSGTGSVVDGFGVGSFNTPPLVEAADSGPFFHDNSVKTIEGAVAFYTSAAFGNSPAGPRIPLEATQIEAISAFLRAINALENIRSARELATTAQSLHSDPRAAPLLRQAIAEIRDAIEVLTGADLHPDAVKNLRMAANLIKPGSGSVSPDAITQLDRARGAIVMP
jgi:cytochrome c peroxidase